MPKSESVRLNTPLNEACINQSIASQARRSRPHYLGKLVQTILLRPITTTATLTFRTVKLFTWVPAKAGLYKVSGYHTESPAYFEREYLKTVKAVRDILFIPSVMKRALEDMVATREEFVDDIARVPTQDYLQVGYDSKIQQFSSYLHGLTSKEVHTPKGITEFTATSDAALKTIMASHLFKPGMMAINFGSPNVATFVTEKGENDSVQTVKVDAKSLRRADMSYHPTNGKIQSGVFLVPTNLPEEALDRFKEAAEKMATEKRRDFTCVNTNCRVLQKSGFSIEGVALNGVVFPTTLMEHLLFRNVFYTGLDGVKHKVHFDILNTTQHSLEEHVEKVDTAVVGTRLRHRHRKADTEEKREARGAAARALIDEEANRLAEAKPDQKVSNEDLKRRKVTVSVPSFFGGAIARIWGRHTMYEVDFSDQKEQISKAFKTLANGCEEDKTGKLHPFPQKKPSFATRLKRDLFFARPMIRFMRRHMMGRADAIHLHTKDLFNHLKSTDGAHLNYVVLGDKMVLARVHANGNSDKTHKRAADWALSKHALLANRQEVYCSGEMWYDKNKNRFVMNNDSGTYKPSSEHLKVVVDLANKIFDAQSFDSTFEAEPIKEETAETAQIK